MDKIVRGAIFYFIRELDGQTKVAAKLRHFVEFEVINATVRFRPSPSTPTS
jgi:hypothetical protein